MQIKSSRLFFSLIFLLSASAQAANCVRIMQDTTAELFDPDKKNTPIVPASQDSTVASTDATKVAETSVASGDVSVIPLEPVSDDASMSEALGAPEAPPIETIPVTTGQLYASPGTDPTGEFMKIVTQRKTYKLPVKLARPIKLKSCFVQPICLIARVDSVGMRNMNDASEKIANFSRGDRLSSIATKMSPQNERAFLVSLDGDYFWVLNKDVAVYTNKTCEEIKDLPLPALPTESTSGASRVKEDKYAFGFEVGFGSGYKSVYYDPFLTDVPDPSNVGPLSNPIITEVKKGTALLIGPLLEIRFSESFKLKLGTQYQENTFKYSGKENPTIASNSLDSLPDTGGQLKNQSLVFSLAPAYELGGSTHRFGLGVNLKTHYYISKPSTITYRVGTVFKANEVTVEAGPKGFESIALLNLYYQWYPSRTSPFALRTTLESDGGVMNLGLSAFY